MAGSIQAQRCLSIQSHVVSGYVGNKSATFPLQLHGIDVSAVNSVQFACHTGYAHRPKGHVLDGEDLMQLMAGLEENGLASFDFLLTGYIGNVDFLRKVLDVLKALKANSAHVAYHCDPVLGDHGKLYVPEALVAEYKRNVVPVADVLTPNEFEAELLSDVSICDLPSALSALSVLHAHGATTVVMTSGDSTAAQCEQHASAAHTPLPAAAAAADMVALVSCPWGLVEGDKLRWSEEERTGTHARFAVTIPRLEGSFTGTGDLTSALLLAWMNKRPGCMVDSMLQVIRTVHAVCRATLELGSSQGQQGKSKLPELQLIASMDAILHPPELEGIQAIPLQAAQPAQVEGIQAIPLQAAQPAQVEGIQAIPLQAAQPAQVAAAAASATGAVLCAASGGS